MNSDPSPADRGSSHEPEGEERLFDLLNNYWETLQRGEPTRPETFLDTRPDAPRQLLEDLRLLEVMNQACQVLAEDTTLPPPEPADQVEAPPLTVDAAPAPLLAHVPIPSFLQQLEEAALIDSAQLAEVSNLQEFAETRELADELVRRGWLTSYQAKQLLLGHGTDLVLGQYVVLARLGEGGMGQVFQARHRTLGHVLALKVIRKDRLAHPDALRRFQREAKAAARLAHPNIVTVHGTDQAGGVHFLAMEYVEGIDLAHLIRERGPLPVTEACEYVRQAALGLQHAHEQGMVHRDIKPGNLIVETKPAAGAVAGVVRVLDMGLARLEQLTAEESVSSFVTQEGALMGTPDYIAPEQAIDSHGVDIRADIYSLGCTLYHLLTGQPPFPGGSLAQKLLCHQQTQPTPVTERRADVPAELDTVLARMMAKRPMHRYATPAKVAAALGPFCQAGSEAISAPAQREEGVSPTRPAPDPAIPSVPQPALGQGAGIDEFGTLTSDAPSLRQPEQGQGGRSGQAEMTAKSARERRDWRNVRGVPAVPPRRRRPWILAATFVGVLLVGSLALNGLLLLRPVKPPHLVLVGADNALNLKVPHNLAGKHNLDTLEEWADNRGTGGNLTVQRVQLGVSEGKPVDLAANHAPWRLWLDKCKGGLTAKAPEKVALILAVHGGADREGPYFVPQDADPADRAGWVRFKDLLAMVKELPDKTEKLLVLDVTQVQAHWPLGMLHNDFVRQLNALDAEIAKVPNLVVICASDEGQRSWVAGDGGPTVFGHFLFEGMRGAAGKDSNRISVQGLFKYVRDEVEKWARDNRNELQKPILLPREEGKARAEKMVLLVSHRNYKGSPPKVAAPALIEELRKAWEEQHSLLQTAPYVYKPHLWRQYLDTLVRYEQLLRAGDVTSASKLAAEVSELKRRMDAPNSLLTEGGRFKLGSSLAMPTALGMVPLPLQDRNTLAQKWNDLWDNPDATADDVRKLYDAPDSAFAVQKRLHLIGALLDRAASDPKSLLTEKKEDRQAVRWAPLLDTRGGPRPAEGHFLVMLPRHLPEQYDPALIKQALTVRKLAEEAAVGLQLANQNGSLLPAYSEQVFPRILQLIEAGDRKRRLGEDRVFTVQKEVWEESKKNLDDAARFYKEAQVIALEFRRVLHQRNEMLAMLPYYSQWMALRSEAGESFDSVEKLWERLHEVDFLLDQPLPDPGSLKERAKEVDDRFQELRGEFERACAALGTLEAIPRRWHETEAVLSVPFIEPRLRGQLLENSREIARQLNIKPSRSGNAPAPAARESAVRHGRMAVAVVGQDRIDNLNAAFEDRPNYETVRAWVEKPLGEGKDWQESLLRAGDEIGHHWQRLSVRVRQLTEQSLQNAKLEEAARDARLAGRLVRHLDGAGARDLGALDPLEEDRRLRLHDLLLWQAQRTFRDHWFGDPNDKEPYFRTAGLQLLADARILAGENRFDINLGGEQKAKWLAQRLRASQTLSDQITRSGGLVTKYLGEDGVYHPGPASLVLTEERGIRRSYRFEMEGELPDGFGGLPVVREDWNQGLNPTPDRDRARKVLGVIDRTGPSQERDYAFTLLEKRVDVSRKEVTAHQVEGFFRGQVFSARTDIALYHQPDLTASYYPVSRGAVAVRVDPAVLRRLKADNLAIAIVLDSSGSMVQDRQANGKTRWENALDALRGVLSEDAAAGVTVSLRVFGPEGDRADEPSRHLWAPQKWDRTRHLEQLMEKLSKLQPKGGTPLVKTTLEARDDFPENFKGLKMVLVVTDGGDYWYRSTQKLAKDLTDGFTGRKNLQLHTISFDPTFGEKPEADNSKQFRATVEELGGKHYDTKDVGALVKRLEESMTPKTSFVVQRIGGSEPHRHGELTQGPYLQWMGGLSAGSYQLHMQLGERTSTDLVVGKVDVRRGDSLVLNVRQQDSTGKFVFERDVWARRDRIGLKSKDWWPEVWQNQLRPGGSLQMMTTIERGQSFEDGTGYLRQVNPGLVIFEVEPEKTEGPLPALRFGPLAGYPAPAWGLDVSGWSPGTKPRLKAWWSDDDATYGNQPPDWLRKLEYGRHFNGSRHTRSDWIIGDQQPLDRIVIESLHVEQHKVKIRPEGKEEEMDCLVVRIQHPKDRPYLVRLWESGGRAYAHGEHRFYREANRYTGIFPGWSNERLKQELDLLKLELVSVPAFKAKAHSETRTLEAPRLDNERPTAVHPYREYE